MTKKLSRILAALGTVILLFFDWRMSVGWLLGWMCLYTLEFFREKFYAVILSDDLFSVGKYIRYILFVFVILWLPLLLAFMFPNVINPYALAASYFVDRLLLFMNGLFTKEIKHGAK